MRIKDSAMFCYEQSSMCRMEQTDSSADFTIVEKHMGKNTTANANRAAISDWEDEGGAAASGQPSSKPLQNSESAE